MWLNLSHINVLMKSLICEGCDSILTVHLSCAEEIWKQSGRRGVSGASTTSLGGLTTAFVLELQELCSRSHHLWCSLGQIHMWLEVFHFLAFPDLLKMAFLFNRISSDNNDCWRPNFPLVWPHGPGSQKNRSWYIGSQGLFLNGTKVTRPSFLTLRSWRRCWCACGWCFCI